MTLWLHQWFMPLTSLAEKTTMDWTHTEQKNLVSLIKIRPNISMGDNSSIHWKISDPQILSYNTTDKIADCIHRSRVDSFQNDLRSMLRIYTFLSVGQGPCHSSKNYHRWVIRNSIRNWATKNDGCILRILDQWQKSCQEMLKSSMLYQRRLLVMYMPRGKDIQW